MTAEGKDLDSGLFGKNWFQILWMVLFAISFVFLGWPLRNIALVCWVHGIDGYFQQGIRVLPGKPIRFSNGEPVPTLPDLVTGFGMFIVFAVLAVLLTSVLRIYGRRFVQMKSKPS